MSFQPRPYQQEAIDRAIAYFHDPAKRKYHALQVLPTGCHAKGTEILMADGSVKLVEEVQPGDHLLGPDSLPRCVLNLCRGREKMYRITPISGAPAFIVNENHILHLVSTNEGKSSSRTSLTGKETACLPVKDYLNKSKYWKHVHKLTRARAVEFAESPKNIIALPGWVLGAILGDGCSMNGVVSITTMDDEIANEFYEYVDTIGCGLRKETKPGNRASTYMIIKKNDLRNGRVENSFMRKLRYLGVANKASGDKFIPLQYKTGSVALRTEVLAGLLDTDGYHDKLGGYDFTSKSHQLASDLVFIARSLGLRATMSPSRKCDQAGTYGDYWRVCLSGNTEFIPCRVPRNIPAKRRQKKNPLVSGFTIEELPEDDFYGFTLDGDHLYLTGDFMIHHNSGKSVVIANIAKGIEGDTLILQPSKEILTQNVKKYMSYGFRAGVYSASAGMKFLDKVTFATIGSIAKKPHLFKRFVNIIIDECHGVNAEDGMYKRFFEAMPQARILGLTATPYRLASNSEGAELRFITRTRPKVFNEVNYYIQNDVLFDAGHLAKLEYYAFNVVDRTMLTVNSSGTDFTEASLRNYYKKIDMPSITTDYANRLLAKKKNLLVFCSMIEEAHKVSRGVPGSVVLTGETEQSLRDRILKEFTTGKIKCVINVGVLTTGFDYPELEAVLLARSTMSLALYYQIVGRVMRPHKDKECGWVVDLGGNVAMFGKIETMKIQQDSKGLFFITNNGRQLTNVPFKKSA